MKIAVIILVLLIGFVGFIFYGQISDEIQEVKVSRLSLIEQDDLEVLSVDNLDQLTNYTHQISTYVNVSDDLVKAASTIAIDKNYVSVFYYQDEDLIHEMFALSAYDTFEIGQISEECVVVFPSKDELETNLKSDELTLYDLKDHAFIHVVPVQTGLYQLSSGEYTLKFELLERKDF